MLHTPRCKECDSVIFYEAAEKPIWMPTICEKCEKKEEERENELARIQTVRTTQK